MEGQDQERAKLLVMRLLALTFLIVGAWLAVAQAQVSPVGMVQKFYAAHQDNEVRGGSQERFIMAQKACFEPGLYRMLSRIARNTPDSGQPWLDFDPFINAQMNAASLRLGSPTTRGDVVSIPVHVSYRVKGHEQLALYVHARREGGAWKIVNFLYPARSGAPAWDLRSWLQKQGMK